MCIRDRLTTYEEWTPQAEEKLREACAWANVIAVGPGFGKSPEALRILEAVLKQTMQPLIIDADALNLLAEHRELLDELIQRQQAVSYTHLDVYKRQGHFSEYP